MLQFGEIISTVFAWLWSAIVATIKWLGGGIDAMIDWIWCTKELIRLGIQEGLDIPAKFMLDDMARVPVLRSVVTMTRALKSSDCVVLAIVILALAALVVWMWIRARRNKRRKCSGMLGLLAALVVIALLLVDLALWGTFLVRW